MSQEATPVTPAEAGTGQNAGTLMTKDLPPAGAEPGTKPAEQPGTAGDPVKPTDPAKPGEADPKPEDGTPDPLSVVPEGPDGYDLTFAKDVSVDTDLLGAFRAGAHELGLNQGQAQKLAELYAGHMAGATEKRDAALRSAIEGWEKEIAASPTFEADKGAAQRVLGQFGSQALVDIVNETYIGSHPEFFRFMAKVGAALGEPEFKGKSAGGGDARTAEQILYPDMK